LRGVACLYLLVAFDFQGKLLLLRDYSCVVVGFVPVLGKTNVLAPCGYGWIDEAFPPIDGIFVHNEATVEDALLDMRQVQDISKE
jgi:hypothetical protein